MTVHWDAVWFEKLPETSQGVMGITLTSLKWQFALVYVDDIVSFSKKPRKHIAHTKMVKKLPWEAGVALKLKKCACFTCGIHYVGHFIKPGRLESVNHTVDTIRKLDVPTTATELR